ncbi:aat family amino acid transporter [Stemphylium lycopersici]|uniref:Aat family amino acid transporter n=1 Tax=Stemphylium lycopersici TaxID=183478 RepID=A0A364N4I7_STELY|nr:aat family amino acid transporter [Stemphylium lycopersici]
MDEEQRPLDRSPYYVTHSEHLDRVLSRPQLAGIGISGCVGGGIFITSGALIATTGSLGAAISYVVAGGIVACVMYTITEMVTCRPLTGALIDLPHTFLDSASGFAVASMYGLGKICAMATLTALSAQLTALLKSDPKPHSTGAEIAINIAFIALTTLSHCLGVKVKYYTARSNGGWTKAGNLLRKSDFIVLLYIHMLTRETDYTTHAFTSDWKPIGHNDTSAEPLALRGVSDDDFGISGPGGTLFAFITSITLAMFSCFGTDLVAMTAGEAKDPWRDVPVTMSFVYLVPLTIYPFAMLAAGSNVNYANPNLSKIWAKSKGATRSPFVIAAEESSLHALPRVLNALFIVSAYTTANTDLYAASRSVFMLSQQYLPRNVANIFGRTNNGHTPLAAILLCSALGFLSLIGLADKSGSQPRITLSQLYTGTATCINLCLCITFLRFKAGLDRLAKRKIFGRNHPLYKSRLFKSRWQPLPAYIGIIGSAFVIVWSGIPPLVILISKGSLTSTDKLKSTISLAFDVLGAYIGPFLFACLYLSYKYIYPRTSRVDLRNLTVEDYVLQDLSNIELEGPTSVPPIPRPRFGSYEMDGQNDSTPGPSHMFEDPFKADQLYVSVSMNPDLQEEIEAEAARSNERARIRQILETRPERMGHGVWRELWSFVKTDREEGTG